MDKNKIDKMMFSMIDPYFTSNIVSNTETELRKSDIVSFGTNNDYPNYIYKLYNNCATLHSIILGTVDYVMGDKIHNNITIMNDNDSEKLVQEIAQDMLVYGGCYLEILRNTFGKIAKINVLNFRNVRSNKDNSKFYYSSDFSSSRSWGRCKYTTYDAFDPNNHKQMQSIYILKNDRRRTYPVPIWCASVLAAETEMHINEFHLNNILNGFSAFHVVNFNNGVPDDEMKREIEEAFNEKFTGVQNAGRVMLSWNNDREHSVDISTLELNNYGE